MSAGHESWIDRQIREAVERGEFDNLPGAGKPLPGLDRRDDDWWIKNLVERERLDGANFSAALPEPVLLRRERDALQATLADVRDEADARAIVEDLNRRIKASHRRPPAPGAPPVFTASVDVEAELATWRQGRG